MIRSVCFLSLLLFGMSGQFAMAQVESMNSYISCHPFAAQADGKQACLVRVTAHDAAGLPVVGKMLTLVSNRGGTDVITPAVVATDKDGRAEFSVRSAVTGTAVLSAQCDGVSIDRGITANGVVAIYTFDGNSPEARVRDLSGNGNHGALHGQPVFVPGRAGQAVSLNGKDQYVEIPNSPSMSGTHGSHVESWIKVAPGAKETDVQVIAQKSHANGGDYSLTVQGHRIAYQYRCTQRAKDQLEEALSDHEAVADEKWTQAAGFWEGANIHERVRFHGYVRAYTCQDRFDPVPKAQQLEGIWNGRNEPQPFSIGRNGAGSQYFHGLIDEVRVYNRALYDEEMRRNHTGETTVTFGLVPPSSFAADAQELPECVVLSWAEHDQNVTTYSLYRATTPVVEITPANLLNTLPHGRDHFRDYEVDYDTTYYYAIVANSFENRSVSSPVVSGTPFKAVSAPRWYLGDGHLHTFTHDVDVEDFDPEGTLFEARKLGWDFALVTDHNSLGAYYRSEDQGTKDFIVIGNGEEISDGGLHRTGAFLKHFIPTSDSDVFDQNKTVLAMGGEVGPNHNPYRDGPNNITLFEAVNNTKWFPFDAWDEQYLKKGIHVTAKGGSDAHGRFSVKRGYRWCVWADRLSYRALRQGIQGGRAVAVDGDGLLCMLKINGAMIGDTLSIPMGTPLTVEISADAKRGNVSEVKLIKFGQTVQTWKPSEKNWQTTFTDGEFDGQPTYYRIEVRSDGTPRRAVSSAVFVQSPAADARK
ncbi:MAG: CehA/McbA family metallohydrolase [Planctomycetota bacterium]